MATGVDDVRVGAQEMKKGADDYLVKPFNLEAVEVSVQRALKKSAWSLISRTTESRTNGGSTHGTTPDGDEAHRTDL